MVGTGDVRHGHSGHRRVEVEEGFIRDDRGTTAIEYAVIATGVSVAIIGAVTAVGSALASHAALGALGYRSVAARLGLAYAAGFAAFKAIILGWALVLGGLHTAMVPDLIAEQFVRNAAILIGLYALYRTLVAAGVPAPPRAAATA